jgi:hypothetical protein
MTIRKHEGCERWGGWSLRVDWAEHWSFAAYRAGWLGITSVFLGPIAIVLTNPVWRPIKAA